MTPLLGGLLEAGMRIIDKVIPDQKAKQEAQFRMLELQQSGELKELETRYQAIVAEAQSPDKWTSRARPSFMYVMYVLLLASIPVGIAFVFAPAEVETGIVGFQKWLAAIPEEMWWLFGAGYLGYSGSRTFEKVRGAAK